MRLLHRIVSGIAALLRKDRDERDLDEELRTFLEADVDERILDAALPAMIVLPLLAGAARSIAGNAPTCGRSPCAAPATLRRSLGFAARIADGDLRIEITAHGAGACDLAGMSLVEDLRTRLHSLYGERASVDVESQSDVLATARLTIPHERLA